LPAVAGDGAWLGRCEYDVNNFIAKLDAGTLCATDSTFAQDSFRVGASAPKGRFWECAGFPALSRRGGLPPRETSFEWG